MFNKRHLADISSTHCIVVKRRICLKMGGSIPDRWLAYSSYGRPLISKFVALKVPLSRLKMSVPSKERFTPEDAIEKLSLGLIIDLTNTSRYYQPSDFTSRGVAHAKLAVRGHVVPPMRVVERFNDIVRSYFNEPGHDGRLIGVHCTHGLNRTGYLICAYMILEEGFQPKEAIKLFNTMRGHTMERANYLQSLCSMVPRRNDGHGPKDHEIPRKYSIPSRHNYRAPNGGVPHRSANGQRSSANEQHRAGNWREDNFRRMYSEQPRRFDMEPRRFDTETRQQHGSSSTQYDVTPHRLDEDNFRRMYSEQSRRFDMEPRRFDAETRQQHGSSSTQYDVAPNRFDDNHRHSRPSQEDNLEIWDPAIRRIVRQRAHNYRLPTHRRPLPNISAKHIKLN